MSPFTFGFVISQLTLLERVDFPSPLMKKLCIKVYARSDLHKDLEQTVKMLRNIFFLFALTTFLIPQRIYERIEKSLLSIQSYLGVDFPLEKLDIVALPNFSTVKPADNWGLIVYK